MRPATLLAAAALAAGCARAPAVPARDASPADYFPLAVGNTWTYLDQSPTLPAGGTAAARTVRILERTPDGFYRDSERGELRAGPDCVRDRVRQLLCAPLEVGNRWTSTVSVASTERYEIAAVGETVVTPAGTFAGCVRVRAHNRAPGGADHVLEMTYAPGIGPVRIETFAVVDGKAAPQIRAVLGSYQLGSAR
jgi:hypothetical protein